MMFTRLKSAIPLGLLLAGGLAHSQVQLFEQEMSGLAPYFGVRWNAGIQEAQFGIEYNIDGRTVLGFNGYKPLKDTLNFDPTVKAYVLNPYAEFEFIEPGSMNNFSFALRADFIQENSTKSAGTPDDPGKFNSFRRTFLGGGPIFALRIFKGEKLAFIPSAGYEFFYVSWHRDELIGNTRGSFPTENNLWHDVSGTLAMLYRFNEFNGISFEPKLVLKFGPGRAPKDLVNVWATLGYAWGF